MTTKKKEQAKVVSQEQLADGIFSMWIQTEAAGSARPGQFISMYTNDGSKLLPRPISICEIDKEGGKLRVVYRVTGEKTGTEEFSQMKAGDTIPVIGPLGNGFPFEKAEGKKVFLMGGGIGVPPILELAKQMECEKKQIVVGYRDAHTFLKEEFDKMGGMDDYKDFSEDERIFYLREAGFDSREKELFRLRVYEEKTLAEASEIMGYSTRTVDRINRKLKKKIMKVAPMYCRGFSLYS